MITPEVNDVDISRLFNWGKLVRVGGYEFYLRVAGDADINRARVYALRRSADLRKKLRDLDSDERVAFIADFDLVEKGNLVEVLLVSVTKAAMLETVEKVNIPFPKELGSNASLEEQEKYQAEVDDWNNKREEAVRQFVTEKVEKARELYTVKSKEELYAEYLRERINDLCEIEMRSAFIEYCLAQNTYTNSSCKEKVFNTVEEFRNLPTSVKDELQYEYNTIELSMDELKK